MQMSTKHETKKTEFAELADVGRRTVADVRHRFDRAGRLAREEWRERHGRPVTERVTRTVSTAVLNMVGWKPADLAADQRVPGLPRNGDVGDDVTREELYERAKALDIPGRSKMSKDELAQALAGRD